MPGFAGRERRKFVRVSPDITVRLRLGETVLTYPAAFARNISTGGLGIEIMGEYPGSYEALANWKDEIEVEIKLAEDVVLRLPAMAVWGQIEGKTDARQFHVGLRFLEIDGPDKTRLDNFVKAKADEMLRQQAARKKLE